MQECPHRCARYISVAINGLYKEAGEKLHLEIKKWQVNEVVEGWMKNSLYDSTIFSLPEEIRELSSSLNW